MGLLYLFKRTASGQTTPLSTTQVDSNWQKIMDLFPTPAAGTTDVGKVPALKADKTGFEYVPLATGGSGGGTWGSITGILSNQTDLQTALNGKVDENAAITGATKTKITYDSKGLVTVGSDASLAELTDDVTHRTVTDTQIATWNALIGGSVFQSVWNATTNIPALASGVGTKGYYYIVNVAGSTNLDGITDWKIGDWAIYDGTVWRKVDNTDAVSSVNSLTGAVSLDTSNVPDTLNKRYVTDANLVVIGNTSGTNTGDNATNSQYSGLAASKQDTLVSGTNIKTINSNSLLGSGDLVITAGDGNDDFMLVASFKSLYNY